jgi:hypothetical protein
MKTTGYFNNLISSESLMMRMFIRSVIIALWLLPAVVAAENHNTDTSPSVAEFEALVAGASSGDTITFLGDATWSSTATVDKALVIDGDGHTLTAGTQLENGLLNITGFTDSSNTVRITNFVFNGVDHTATGLAIKINAVTITNLQIDHNVFYYFSETIEVGGSYGVIYDNTFYNAYQAIMYTAGTRAQADASWVDLSAGTANALFIEDNQFIHNSNYPSESTQEQIGTFNGGKLVVRYNTFDTTNSAYAGNADFLMTHGSAKGGGGASGYWQEENDVRRGQAIVEIYKNSMTGQRIDHAFTLRGGSNLIWNNSHSDSYGGSCDILLDEEEYYDTDNWSTTRTEWPAEDQIFNTFIWSNMLDGEALASDDINVRDFNSYCTDANTPMSCCSGSEAGTCNKAEADALLKEDRDYFLHAPQSSGGSESFTGANGAAGSHPTDGDPYATSGTMTFSAVGANAYYGYVPYTYPHPLRGIGTVTSKGNPGGTAEFTGAGSTIIGE